MPRRSVVTLGLLLFVVVTAAAADLPRWDDDSAVTVTPYPRTFSPNLESTNLVAQVFHPIDARTEVRWNVAVTNAEGQSVRRFEARQSFSPGEAMMFAPSWNGRDDLGRYLPNGTYNVTVGVEMRAVGARVRPSEDGDEHPRVEVIRQQASHAVIIDSVRRHRVAAPQSQAPHDPGVPYNFYYGTLHNQTRYSDGGHPNDSNCASSTTHGGSDLDPAQAYTYARNTAALDFLGITDHNHQFNDACSGCTAAQIVQRYHDGLAAAAAATVDGTFVGIYGMEWGYISTASFPHEGHVGVFESPKLFGWEPSSTCTVGVDCYYDIYTNQSGASYPAMYTTALQNPSPWGAFGQFMHPSDGTKSAAGQGVDFNSIQYTTDGDDFIHTAAVISGPATDYSTATADTGALYAGEPVNGPSYAAYTSTDMYNRILGAGYHVAPAADPDVHCANYGTSTRDRTVILAGSLTKAALFDAIQNRRVYATSDSNVQLVYTMTAGASTYWMGAGGIRANGPMATSGAITLHVSVWDPDAGEFASSIKIKEPVPGNTNGAETLIASSTASPFDFTFTPSAGNHAYYAYVTMNTGDRVFSAPVWINQGGGGGADTTPPSAPSNLSASAARKKINLTWSASTDNVGVTGYQVWRSTSATGTFTQIATTTTTSYSDSVASRSTFFYYVTASDAAGNVSAASNTASATAK
jgi:hypothetical protein